MRADRLLTLLLLLQIHGKMTAEELARELEVSERTIYRDIDSLCFAGVPVYSESGHGGGFALIENYRTQLTGLNKDELHALFMLGSLTPLADLGLSKKLQSALLKINASLSQNNTNYEEKMHQCFYYDSTRWYPTEDSIPHLLVVQEAVWGNRKLRLVYRPQYSIEITQDVSPYGLVAKAGVWYLVCAKGDAIHVHRVSDLISAQILEEVFDRPEGFDLVSFWKTWCSDYEVILSHFIVTVNVAPAMLPELQKYFGNSIYDQINNTGNRDSKGWIRLKLSFYSFEAARERILGLGGAVEVLEPRALRQSVIDYAEQINALYSK